jgi:putative tricarboxylic transport membrane protein
MRLHDTPSGLLLLLFGASVAFYSHSFPITAEQRVGPGTFPTLIGIALSVCGAVLIASGRRQRGAAWVEGESWVREPRLALNAALVVTALIVYALAVETLGFFITAFMLLTALFLAFGVSRRWIVPVAVTVTFGLHVAFYSLLRVPLPWGWLEPIAW